MIGAPISKRTRWGCAILAVLVLLVGYTHLSRAQFQKNPLARTVPTWTQLWGGLRYLCEQPRTTADDTSNLLAAALRAGGMPAGHASEERGFLEGRILWEASKATLTRLVTGLLIGLAGGVVVGILMGCFLPLDAAVSPILYFASRIIPTAALPLFFRFVGIEFEMYVSMIAFGSMPIVTLTVSQYVREYPDELRYKAYTLGASHSEVITCAIFPYVLPKVLDLAILMIGPALVYLIAAEQIVAGEGFGYRIRVLTKATRFDVVYALILMLTVYAGFFTLVLRKLQAYACPWYGKEGH